MWSFSCPDSLKGGSLYGALLEVREEVPGTKLHSFEFTVIHSVAISNRNFLNLR